MCECVFTSLPMTLIHTCSPTSTISEAFSIREADISLTCTRPVMYQEKKKTLLNKKMSAEECDTV